MATETKELPSKIEDLNLQQRQRLEYHRVCKSFIYFLDKYGVISEAPTQTKAGGTIKFQLWPHILDGASHLINDRLIAVIKARQIGWSWLVAHYALWTAITKDNSRVMLFSKGEKECWELMGKCKFIWTQLPPFMKFRLDSDSKEELSFPDKYSKIKAFASTVSAGVGETATVVVCDELEWHDYAAQNFNQVKPTISNGGQYIGLSTVDKRKPNSLLKNLFKGAYYDKNNGFTALFYPYNVRPGWDEEWYEKEKQSVPHDELGGLTPDLYMQQNHPRTVEEALSPVQSVSVFDLNSVDVMIESARPPLNLKEKYPDLNFRICNIYKDFQIGRTYVAATDTGHGVGKDYSVTGILDIKAMEIVADILVNNMSVEDFARWSVELLRIYHSPKWFPEDNDQGKWLIATAVNLGYKSWGYYDIKKHKIGWHTGGNNRGEIWGKVIPAVNNNQLIAHNVKGLSQLRDVQYYTGKDGLSDPRIEAPPGRHDDYPVMLGIALCVADKVPLGSISLKPIETLSFA